MKSAIIFLDIFTGLAGATLSQIPEAPRGDRVLHVSPTEKQKPIKPQKQGKK